MKEGEKTVFTCSWKNDVNIHGILFSCSLCVILWQAVDANTPKPWGCPQLIGAIEARLEGLSARLAQAVAKLIWGVLQGSGQVTVVPGHCDNLGLYRQNICIWMQPATLQGLFFRFPGGWSSSSGTHGVCGSSPGVGVTLLGWLFVHMGFPPSGEGFWVGFGIHRAVPDVLLEPGLSLLLGRWDSSCLSVWRSPAGPQEILAKSQHHQHPLCPHCSVFFQLPPSEISVLTFMSNLCFPITKCGGKEVTEGTHEQIHKGKNVFFF